MSQRGNAVERRMCGMRDLWMQATQDHEARLFVWRMPPTGERLLDVFLEAQKREGPWSVPDLFLNLDAECETGFGFSRQLRQALLDAYLGSRDDFKEQGAERWDGSAESYPESAAGVVSLLRSFAAHHGRFFRRLVLVVRPREVSSPDVLERWLLSAVEASADAPRLALSVLQDRGSGRWDAVLAQSKARARVIDADIDMFDVAREIAAQSGGAGPATAFRPVLADVMTSLERGDAERTTRIAARGLRIAERHGWWEQQVTLHLAVAGAWLKEQDFANALAGYRRGLSCALQAQAAAHPVAGNLVVQCRFGEAGAWLAARSLDRAAEAYREASRDAQRIPHAMFAIEGLRMAGFCEGLAGRRDRARDDLMGAVQAARALPPAERAMTTFPIALNDLLRLQDETRAARIERTATDYQEELARARRVADDEAQRLGERATAAELDAVEARMLDASESAFARFGHAREKLIEGGDPFFRKVVAVGRDWLHPAWNGLPDVSHPLDKEPGEWNEPPSFVVAPDGAALDGLGRAVRDGMEQQTMEAAT